MNHALLLRSLRSGWRLFKGALRLPIALWRGHRIQPLIVFVDVFGTLLARAGDDDGAWRDATWRAADVARAAGHVVPADPLLSRLEIEGRLIDRLKSAGQDPEFSNEPVFCEMLESWGAGKWASNVSADLAHWQLDREICYTRPLQEIAQWVKECVSSGIPVVAVSDTRYTGDELSKLLSKHGISGLKTIYASSEYAASKFSGRLFDIVMRKENVTCGHLLHVGDNLVTDALAPAQRGVAVRRVRENTRSALPPAPLDSRAAEDTDFAVGYQTLGPILVAFVRLLFGAARRDGIRQLAFVARDGDLLVRVARTIAEHNPGIGPMELRYVHLSRRALACVSPDLQHLSDDPGAVDRVMATLQSIRGMGTPVEGFQNYYGIPPELLARETHRLRLICTEISELRRLLRDPATAAALSEAMLPLRDRLRRYLLQEKIMASDSALVDIGWRGSLQKILQARAREWDLPAPRGYYVGLWDEDSRRSPIDAAGILSSQQRGRGLRESSAWQAAFLLEAVCRAKHGIVAGFVEDQNGNVAPLHVESGGTREAERESERTQGRVQEGILSYAQWFATSCPVTVANEEEVRRDAQKRLLRLAFFPRAIERAVGRRLVHSEPTSDDSALWLIADAGNGLRDWLSGLRSPWKGGYLRENGGIVLAAGYCFTEAILSHLPGAKLAVRRVLVGNQ